MKRKIANNVLSLAIAVLLACMALPSVAKLSHVIHGHTERGCSKDARLHFHTAEFDCVFQKFKNTPTLYHSLVTFKIKIPRHYALFQIPEYNFLSHFPPLSFSLRAPPLVS